MNPIESLCQCVSLLLSSFELENGSHKKNYFSRKSETIKIIWKDYTQQSVPDDTLILLLAISIKK